MPQAPAVPGQAQEASLLEQYARPALIPPEDFIGAQIFPDAETPSFFGIAPAPGNDELGDIDDDDTIGDETDYKQVSFADNFYNFELGMRGRKFIIGRVAIEKARIAAQMSGGVGNPLFDLESRGTNFIVSQHMRRLEFLKMRALANTALYPGGNVLGSIEIDTVTAAAFIARLSVAAFIVGGAGRGPANAIVFGYGAWNGAMANANFADLFPDTAYKIVAPEMFMPILKLPEEANPRVRVATATYRPKGKRTLDPVPMFNDFIWVGRIDPNPGTTGGNGFGRGYWHPCPENGQRNYVNRLLVGNAETRHIGVYGYDRPVVNDNKLGVIFPVTHPA